VIFTIPDDGMSSGDLVCLSRFPGFAPQQVVDHNFDFGILQKVKGYGCWHIKRVGATLNPRS